MTQPLLVFAMKEESQDIFSGHNILYTGIGKINAAFSLTRYIANTRPDIVINLGTAGSRRFKKGHIINPAQFIQRDMDVSVLGFERFQTPFSDDPIILEYGRRISALNTGICGTGDSFDASDAANQFDLVDMEAYALALICRRENIPFFMFKIYLRWC